MAPAPSVWRRLLLDLNIDVLLNPFIPHNHLNVLPDHVSHWLGYRHQKTTDPPALLRFPIIFLATVAGLCLVGGIFNYAPGIVEWSPPVLIASLGASAILDYNAIQSPMSQPRNVILGHTLAAIVGVGISKLFQLHPDFDKIQWVSGAVGCACSSIAMSLMNSLHPPGGATAVLASADKQIVALGWKFVPLILLATSLMTAVACIFNNFFRQYPLHWWTPESTGQKLPYPASRLRSRDEDAPVSGESKHDVEKGKPSLDDQASHNSNVTLAEDRSHGVTLTGTAVFPISPLRAHLPPNMQLSAVEIAVLEQLDSRMRSM